jgi:hypothetical protein
LFGSKHRQPITKETKAMARYFLGIGTREMAEKGDFTGVTEVASVDSFEDFIRAYKALKSNELKAGEFIYAEDSVEGGVYNTAYLDFLANELA